MFRTHTNGELSLKNLNETVTLAGWVKYQKNSKNEGGEAFLFCSNDHYSSKRWHFSLTNRKRDRKSTV